MKGVLIVVGLLLAMAMGRLLAQGTIAFDNRVPGLVDARFVLADGSGMGEGWTAQLLGGPLNTSFNQLRPLFPTTSFNVSSAATMGYVIPVDVIVPGVRPGGQATIVMVAFFGATFDLALPPCRSISIPITVTLGGDGFPSANLIGVLGVANTGLCIVPEPRNGFLLGVGCVFFLFRRRRVSRGHQGD
jgi:hypothetical protein